MNTLLARRRRDERGVVAIMFAVLALVILMFAAYAVDIGLQVNRKHNLNDTLDAAAQAGAYALPGSTATAKSEALAFATAHNRTETGSLVPNVDFWCIVASKVSGGSNVVDTYQIPATCNPGTSPYTPNATYKATGRMVTCGPILCAIPCVEPTPNNGTPKIACNTIRVYQGREVPFSFAPAGGIPSGNTGNIVSVACKGSCGTINPNPLDVAVVADRTSSMGDADIGKLVLGIKGMLQQMTPAQQFVSLGTIGRSAQTSTSSAASKACDSTNKGLTWGSTSSTSGLWMPIAFSNDYQTDPGTLNPNSALVKGVGCLENQSDPAQGTVLAAPMKSAARYLLGTDSNNISSLTPARSLVPQKVLIFETDGQPNERTASASTGSTSLTVTGDIFSDPLDTDAGLTTTTNTSGTPVMTNLNKTSTTLITHNKTVTYTYNGGNKACQNLLAVANNAKAAGIQVIMIGYNMTAADDGTPKRCNDYDGVADNYGNLNSVTHPERSAVNTSTTSAAVANPGETTTTTSGGVTYVKNYQTVTTTKYVEGPPGPTVLSIMAQAASSVVDSDGIVTPTSAQSDCSDSTERAAENSDGDFLFCAASGTDMAPIFRTALSQATKGIKLLKLP